MASALQCFSWTGLHYFYSFSVPCFKTVNPRERLLGWRRLEGRARLLGWRRLVQGEAVKLEEAVDGGVTMVRWR